MWIRLSAWLYTVSTAPVAALALLVFLAFSLIVLPGQAAAANANAHGGGSPDTSFLYSTDDLFHMAEAHGPAGRDAYVRARWTFDLAFPLVYGAFLATAISWLFRATVPARSAWRMANLAPVLAVIFDFCENTCTSLVMLAYPERVALTANLAAIFTPVKWLLVLSSVLLLLAGLWLRLRRRRA